jgi:hypothetical protein
VHCVEGKSCDKRISVRDRVHSECIVRCFETQAPSGLVQLVDAGEASENIVSLGWGGMSQHFAGF